MGERYERGTVRPPYFHFPMPAMLLRTRQGSITGCTPMHSPATTGRILPPFTHALIHQPHMTASQDAHPCNHLPLLPAPCTHLPASPACTGTRTGQHHGRGACHATTGSILPPYMHVSQPCLHRYAHWTASLGVL